MSNLLPYPMRRKDRLLPEAEALSILTSGQYGTLATTGSDGQPYGVPLSYVVVDNHIYFHCANEGRKISNLAYCPRACFTVVGRVQAVYDNSFSTWFESCMVFGTICKIEDTQEKQKILLALAKKYLPAYVEAHADHDIAQSLAITSIYAMSMDIMTGKAKKAREYA